MCDAWWSSGVRMVNDACSVEWCAACKKLSINSATDPHGPLTSYSTRIIRTPLDIDHASFDYPIRTPLDIRPVTLWARRLFFTYSLGQLGKRRGTISIRHAIKARGMATVRLWGRSIMASYRAASKTSSAIAAPKGTRF